MAVATDPDPYFAFPKLYGAPAYGRAPRVVPESERPLDPDDLPIAAEMTEEERTYAAAVLGPAYVYPASMAVSAELPPPAGAVAVAGAPANDRGSDASGSRRLSLRALTGRIGGPSQK